tara:strand:- start:407 stop:880 length:474 start_codon:yes stop_codon:yes gene_type:complete
MTTLTFTIASIYDPKEGKKTGSIKTTSDKWISYWPSDKGQFVAGNSYSAVCSTREWEGKTYFTVNSPGKNGNITNTGGTPTPVAQNAPQQAPTPSHGVAKDEIISRLAIAKSCIEANQSQADADSWMAWVEKRSEAPQSPQQMEQPQDDFGDTDIPF